MFKGFIGHHQQSLHYLSYQAQVSRTQQRVAKMEKLTS